MRMTFVCFAFIVCMICSTNSENLTATISMDNVWATLEFQASASDVVVTISATPRTKLPTGQASLSIHQVWMEYDVADKCSNQQLGDELKSPQLWNSPVSNSLTFADTSLSSLEGKSVVMTANGTKYCTTILKQGSYNTAIAAFKSKVYGSVFFRQFDGNNEQTLLVSQLVSEEVFANPKWKITDDIKSCDDEDSLAGAPVFNPGRSKTPAVGDLTSKVGAPPLETSNNPQRTPFSNSDLPLSGDYNIINKYLVILDSNQPEKSACAKIKLFHPKKATALFSHQGIHGHISFMQASPLDMTYTSMQLQGLNTNAKGYHVHLYPVPVQTEKSQSLCSGDIVAGHFNPYGINSPFPAPTQGTDDEYEVGDLSSKYGTLKGFNETSANYTDWNLPLFGKNSIVGRSIVIHRDDDSNSRWVCSNIQLDTSVISAVATFKYPVYGHIYFSQAMDMPDSESWIFSRLSFLDNRPSSSGHYWHINTEKVGDDMMSSAAERCSSTGMVFDPFRGASCTNQDMPMKCKLGDMSSKLGTLSIDSDSMAEAYFTDTVLPLSGGKSIIGRSVVIKQKTGSGILACATIEKLHKPMLRAELNSGGISGTVSFSQEPGYGQRPTTVTVDLSGLNSQQQKLQIHSLSPMDDDDKKCSDLGSIYNPLEVGQSSSASTHDQFILGDLYRDNMGKDLNLPLTGRTSIRHRSLVVVDSNSNVITCGIIQDPFSRTFGGYQVSTRAVFSSPLEGYIDMFQTLYADDTVTDTTVVVNLRNVDGSKTQNHNWHVHEKPISGDASASTGRCSSAGPHYDPFMAKIGNATTQYSLQCSKMNPLRCELGDQAKKLGTYSLGGGRKVFTDIDLPLNGMYKVQGRSFVVHVKDMGAARYSCADIIPVDKTGVVVKFQEPQQIDLLEAASRYASVINAIDEVVVTLVSSSGGVMEVKVYFLGNQRSMFHARFMAFFTTEENRKNFGKYAPISKPIRAGSGADAASISTATLLMILLLTVVAMY